jgi:hypothetical protein
MTIAELNKKIEYLTDATGQRKAVVLDLAVWEEIVAALKQSDNLKADSESKDAGQEPNRRLLALLRNPPDDDKDDIWWNEFEQELRDNRMIFQREIDLDR